jgi:hypothetical protein
MPIALVFIGAMLVLPEPGASVAQLMCATVGYPVLLLLAGCMALMPGGIAYTFSKTIVETFPRWLQVVALLAWFLLLLAISLLLYSRSIRRAVRRWLDTGAPEWLRDAVPNDRMTVWLAIALYVNFVFIAAGCFASIAYFIHSMAPLFQPTGRHAVEHGTLADFLLWHLLDAIPGLKVPETIKWEAPLTYQHAGAGWLVLLFKVMVIVPVVSGIGHYLRDENPADTDEATLPPRPGAVGPSQ